MRHPGPHRITQPPDEPRRWSPRRWSARRRSARRRALLAGLLVLALAALVGGVWRLTHPPSRCPGLVAAMAPRDRLAQRLMVGVDADRPEEVAAEVGRDHVGGIFLGGNATALLRDGALARVQAAAGTRTGETPIPVAVAVDDEGGRVQRIDALVGPMPSARDMAATRTPEQVRALAAARGRALRSMGITMDLAPVLDVTGQPADTVIGDRSFSVDPGRVARYAGAFAAGLRDAGVLPVLKHFPGHGHASGDSHLGTVSTPPLGTLEATDLRPYRVLLGDRDGGDRDGGDRDGRDGDGHGNGGRAAVMVGHLDVPGLTGGLPATLSPAAYRLLRDEFGFTGLVLTDDLGAMRAISAGHPLPDAVLEALQAGADMALTTTDDRSGRIDAVLDRLQAAAAAGQLPGSDEAVGRVLAAKGMC